MVLDNSTIVAKFVPEKNDGDTFIYTELLDRSKDNKGRRIVKSFFHFSQEEFWDQWPDIKDLCDFARKRAVTRLSKRSLRKVGEDLTKRTVSHALRGEWKVMKSLFNKACGNISPEEKIWLFDIDVIDDRTKKLGKFIEDQGKLLATIPSKKGLHYAFKPFDLRLITAKLSSLNLSLEEASIHKDNPTNLYIPEGVD